MKDFALVNLFLFAVIIFGSLSFLVLVSLAIVVHPKLAGPAAVLSLIATGYAAARFHRYVEKRRAH